MNYARIETPGGWKAVITGKVREGELLIEETWQDITMDWTTPDPVGSACTLRTAWLNGELVTDPATAQRLHAELAEAARQVAVSGYASLAPQRQELIDRMAGDGTQARRRQPELDQDNRCRACGVHWNLCTWCSRWWTGSHSCGAP